MLDENIRKEIIMQMEPKVQPQIIGEKREVRFHIGATFSGYFDQKYIGAWLNSRHAPTLHRIESNMKSPMANPALSSSI